MHCNQAATFDDRYFDISAMILKDARLLHAPENKPPKTLCIHCMQVVMLMTGALELVPACTTLLLLRVLWFPWEMLTQHRATLSLTVSHVHQSSSSLTCLRSLTNACVNACVNARQDKTRHLSVRFHPVTRLGCSQCTLFPHLPSTQPAVCLH